MCYLFDQESAGSLTRIIIQCRTLPKGSSVYKTSVGALKPKPGSLTCSELWLVVLGYENQLQNISGSKFMHGEISPSLNITL